MAIMILLVVIGALNGVAFAVFRYRTRRRHALEMIEQHQKGFRLGWESGQELVFEMDVRDYARARIKYENEKEL